MFMHTTNRQYVNYDMDIRNLLYIIRLNTKIGKPNIYIETSFKLAKVNLN